MDPREEEDMGCALGLIPLVHLVDLKIQPIPIFHNHPHVDLRRGASVTQILIICDRPTI